MTNYKNAMAALVLGLAITPSSPALAKNRAPHGYDARAQAIQDNSASRTATGQRSETIRECNQRAAPFLEYVWGNMQTDQYRACMAEHGETE
jgi:hypothetical protein